MSNASNYVVVNDFIVRFERKQISFEFERGKKQKTHNTTFSLLLHSRKRPESDQKNVLPPLASLRLVSHMITLPSSLVISLSERHLVSAKTAISFHRSSCLLCFKHFRSSVKRSSIDTRSVVRVPFHISPPLPIFISSQ